MRIPPTNFAVILESGEDSEYLIKRFMRKFKKSDILKIILERRSYKKPSKIKREREAKRLATIRRLKEEGLI